MPIENNVYDNVLPLFVIQAIIEGVDIEEGDVVEVVEDLEEAEEIVELDEDDVNEEVDKLVHDILKHDPEYNKDNVKIIHPKQLCKLTTKTNKILQQILLNNTKYEGSCSIFSMWYSFNRILYPEKESEQIYKEMNRIAHN